MDSWYGYSYYSVRARTQCNFAFPVSLHSVRFLTLPCESSTLSVTTRVRVCLKRKLRKRYRRSWVRTAVDCGRNGKLATSHRLDVSCRLLSDPPDPRPGPRLRLRPGPSSLKGPFLSLSNHTQNHIHSLCEPDLGLTSLRFDRCTCRAGNHLTVPYLCCFVLPAVHSFIVHTRYLTYPTAAAAAAAAAMRLLTRLALGLLGLAAAAVAEDPSTQSAIDLQPTTFRAFIKENDVVMAEFYAVCTRTMAPNWIQYPS